MWVNATFTSLKAAEMAETGGMVNMLWKKLDQRSSIVMCFDLDIRVSSSVAHIYSSSVT